MKKLLLYFAIAGFATAQVVVPIEDGGTGANTAANARVNLGFGSETPTGTGAAVRGGGDIGAATGSSLTLTGNIVLSTSASSINTGTTNGADAKLVAFAGGGASTSDRGAFLNAIGNEYATAAFQGVVELVAGYDAAFADTNAGSIRFSAGGAEKVRLWRSGGLAVGGVTTDPGANNLRVAGTITTGTIIGTASSRWFGGDGGTGWFLNAPTGGAVTLGLNNAGKVAITDTLTTITNAATTVTGNLTVSGSGNHSLNGNLLFPGDQTAYLIRTGAYGGAIRLRGNSSSSSDRALQFGRTDNSGAWMSHAALDASTGDFTLFSGNLTVSGTGTHTLAGELQFGSKGSASVTRTGMNGVGAHSVFTIASDAKTANDGPRLLFSAKDSGDATQTLGYIEAKITDPTAASEDSNISISNIIAGTLTEGIAINATGVSLKGTSAITGVRTATSTLAFGTINTLTGTTLTITVTGAAQGDSVIVDRTDAGNWGDGMIMSKWATANTVHVRLWNMSGSNILVGSPTVRATVISF